MTFQPSARMIARQRGIDLGSLIEILSWRRAYNTASEMEFIVTTLDHIDGMTFDECGNRYLRIDNSDGTQSNVMWSCHTDTVHSPAKDTPRQNIKWDAQQNILMLNEGKAGQCLGADDGAGLWLMLQMIQNKKPGLYIFHRGEERGGIGSRWIEKNTPELLDGIDFAIAFDRKDLSSVITYQGGTRCCSDDFGNSLAVALNRVGLTMKLDTTGSFTDTAVYTDLVAECTNVSVGYYGQHGPRETLDARHMIKLYDAVMQLDPEADFVLSRVAGEYESKYKNWGSNNWGYNQSTTLTVVPDDQVAYNAWLESQSATVGNGRLIRTEKSEDQRVLENLTRMVSAFPAIAAEMLMEAGFDHGDFADIVLVRTAFADDPVSDDDEDDRDLADAAFEPYDSVICDNCHTVVNMDLVDEDLWCPYCYARLEDAAEAFLARERENA